MREKGGEQADGMRWGEEVASLVRLTRVEGGRGKACFYHQQEGKKIREKKKKKKKKHGAEE